MFINLLKTIWFITVGSLVGIFLLARLLIAGAVGFIYALALIGASVVYAITKKSP